MCNFLYPFPVNSGQIAPNSQLLFQYLAGCVLPLLPPLHLELANF